MVHVQLAPEQPEQLRRLTHQKGLAPSFRNRLERVRLADAGGSAPIIARHLGYHEETVREWPKRFLVLGFEGLKDQPRSGHPRRFTEARRQALEAHPDTSPQGWTAPQLVAWLRERFGVEVSADHLQGVLRERGFRWKRTQPWVGYHRKDKPKDQGLLLFRLMVSKAMGVIIARTSRRTRASATSERRSWRRSNKEAQAGQCRVVYLDQRGFSPTLPTGYS